jgi:glycosyltransferase involved in cell wall biosynthesis
MRIGLDLRPFLKEATGIGVYYRSLLFSLAGIDHSNEYYLFSASFKDRFPASQLPPFHKLQVCDRRWPSQLVDWLWSRLHKPRLETFFRAAPFDLTHSPTPLRLPSRGKSIVTLHDLFFREHPDQVDPRTRSLFGRYVGASIQKADGVIAVSQYTKDTAVRLFALDPDKVRVIHHGTKQSLMSAPAEVPDTDLREKYRLPERFLLFVGTDEPRKNLPALIDALKLVNRSEKISLVIAGGTGSDRSRVQARIADHKLDSSVLFLGYLPEGELSVLYRMAALLVFPSWCEGFGLPLLEAMAAGIPAVVSRTSALPEIGREAALYFDPSSAEEMAAAILQVLKDADLQHTLVERGKQRAQDFSWTRAAESTLEFYRDVMTGGPA